jgi:hypothetical protein
MDSVGILGGCDRQPPLHLQGSSRLKTASWIRELDSGCWISKRSRQDQGQDKARSRQATATSRGLRLRHAHLNRRDEGRAAFWRPIRFKTRPADPSGSAESVALGTLSLRAIADVARRRLVPAGKTVVWTLDSWATLQAGLERDSSWTQAGHKVPRSVETAGKEQSPSDDALCFSRGLRQVWKV